MNLRNITVSVDEETHRRARIVAAALDTSVSALVREYLRNLSKGSVGRSVTITPESDVDLEIRRQKFREVLADFDARGIGLHMSDNLSREELYDRDRARSDADAAHGRNTQA